MRSPDPKSIPKVSCAAPQGGNSIHRPWQRALPLALLGVAIGVIGWVTAPVQGVETPPEAAAVSRPASDMTKPELVKPNLPAKKLLEYGWDVPDPEYIRDHIREMEKRPFDGVVFRLPGTGGHIFDVKAWDEAKLKPQLEILSAIKWGRFTDNFLILYAASTMDWFSDEDWKSVLAHARFAARAAKTAGCKGIVFDPEPYGGNAWQYGGQPHAKDKTYTAYAAQVRRRGAQLMRAMEQEMPQMKLLGLYQFSMPYTLAGHATDPGERAVQANKTGYSLMSPFLDGMLEAAGPGIQFIDGNEFSYYYRSAADFYEAYHMMRQSAKLYVAPELRDKFDRQVRAGQALYADVLFNLRPDVHVNGPAVFMTPEQRANWCQHNTYYGLRSSDEYVWLYSEKMNWWTDENIPPGMEAALIEAKSKLENGEPMDVGFQMKQGN